MKEREVETDRLIWVIPAKIKKEGEPYIYEGSFKRYLNRFEFHHHNGSTTHKFKIPLLEYKQGRHYMKFELEYGRQQFVIFFESNNLHLVMSDNH